MSLTEKLLGLDMAKYKEKKTSTLEIKRLSEAVGEPFIIKVQEVESDRLQELQTELLDKKGRVDYSKTRKINALVCVEGVIEPDLKDKNLQKHFGTNTPKELAEMLFKGVDLGRVADAILDASNFGDSGDEEEKN